jgi:hypothetical protein
VLSFPPLDNTIFRATAMDVYEAPSPTPDRPAGRRISRQAPLLIAAHGPRLHAYNLLTGEVAWTTKLAWPSNTYPTSLRVRRDLLITTAADRFAVCDVASGEMIGGTDILDAAQLISVSVHRGRAYGLFRDHPAFTRTGREAGLFLTAVPLARPGERPATRPSPPPLSGHVLTASVAPRQVVWAGRQLVLVEQKSLRAYTLP